MIDASQLSLADFYMGESDDPLRPPDEFAEWRRETRWATSLYEQSLLAGPTPRTMLETCEGPRPVLNFSSYNYLGLATHPEIVAAAQHALATYGTGACGSPILSGTTDLHHALARRLSAFLGAFEEPDFIDSMLALHGLDTRGLYFRSPQHSWTDL